MAGIGSRHPIKIKQYTTTKNAEGDLVASESSVMAGFAEVRQTSGYREFLNGQPQAGTVKEFRIRYHQSIPTDVNTRIEYGGKLYAVTGIEKDQEKNFYWIIRATAVDNGFRV